MAIEETKPEVAEEEPNSDATEEELKSEASEESDEMKDVRDLIQSLKDELTELRSSIADMLVEKPAEIDESSDADETKDTDDSDLIDIDELDL